MNKSKYDISDVDIINEAYNNNEVVVKYSDEGSEHEDIVNPNAMRRLTAMFLARETFSFLLLP